MTTAGQVLDLARSQIGYQEAPGNRTKYGAAYGMDGVAWCAMFAWWCFTGVGGSALCPKTAYTPTMASWFQQQGRASRTPRVGSLVFYNFPDSLDRIQHVGLVEAISTTGLITTIEGNTSGGDTGSQSSGGGVWRRVRSQSSVVIYGHPAYSSARAAATFDSARMATLTQGMVRDSRVIALQRFLNVHDWTPDLPLLVCDGSYGPATVRVVAGAQRQVGITGPDADGTIVGPRSKAAFGALGARW